MNRMTALCITGMFCISLVPVPSLAGDTASYAVQCTIPAIPGVNAPLIEEDRITAPPSASLQEAVEKPLEGTQVTSEAQTTPSQRVLTVYER